MKFSLLGGIEARVGGRPVDLGHTRQRLVLAALLEDVNHPVPVDQLIERVWGEGAPQRARGTLYSYLSRLRQALAGGEGADILRRPEGYVLTTEADAVDLHHFRRLVAQARTCGDDGRALTLFGQALDLWRGPAFGDVDLPWINALRDVLDQEKLAAELDYGDILLRGGQHRELLVRLGVRIGEHPLDERLAGQFMLALYRCGRPAHALRHYQELRSRLATELGIDPSPELRRLHQRILTADSGLAPDPASSRSEPPPPPPRTPLPRQLPSLPAQFTGRAGELNELSAALEASSECGGTVVIAAVGGTGGVGKTWLALRWAHEHLDSFPDGQLYVNLRGFDPTGEALTPSVVMRGFLDALGVEPEAMPADFEAQAGLYRSLVSGKRMLVVLDNARDTEQVRPLLPGSPSCTVLVTSRRQLSGLVTTHAARQLSLDVLEEGEARQLLGGHLGSSRMAEEPEAVEALLQRCAGLPLALSIVAARAAAQPEFPLAVLVEELDEVASRLDALDAGDLTANLRAVFACSYEALDPQEAEAFGLLGLSPGPDISVEAAACLTGKEIPRVRALLRDLQATYLIQQPRPGRYRFHDLVRIYAAERGERGQSPTACDAALRRLADFHLHTADRGNRLIEPHPPFTVDPSPPANGWALISPLRDEEAATRWFDTEHSCLIATQRVALERGWHTMVWQLAWTLSAYYRKVGCRREGLEMWRGALAAIQQLDDSHSLAMAHWGLGHSCLLAVRPDEALRHLSQALDLFQRLGDTAGEGHTLFLLSWSWNQKGDNERALAYAYLCLESYRELGDPIWEARVRNSAGWSLALLDRYEEARTYCEQTLAMSRGQDDRLCEAATQDILGYIAERTGQYPLAVHHYHEALVLLREVGLMFDQPEVLIRLGNTYQALGQGDEAQHAWQQALSLLDAQRRVAQTPAIRERLPPPVGPGQAVVVPPLGG